MQRSLLVPASQGTLFTTEVEPSVFRVGTFSRNVCDTFEGRQVTRDIQIH